MAAFQSRDRVAHVVPIAPAHWLSALYQVQQPPAGLDRRSRDRPQGAFLVFDRSSHTLTQVQGIGFHRASSFRKRHILPSLSSYVYGWREGAAHQFFGPNNATDLWSVKKVTPQNMVHLTEKPVELAVRALEYSSRRGEHVLDLFGGSGSTLIAAEQTGRRAYLLELDPLYCDVIVARWEQFTGRSAERAAP
jgi:hypothetical protein